MAETSVVHNAEASRFEMEIDGHLAELAYERDGDRMVIVHTEVPEALEGRGLGGDLVTAAVDHAVAEHLTIVPRCSFANGWLERHPDVAGRAPIEHA